MPLFNRTFQFTLIVTLLLVTAQRLPAPISEIETPTPLPEQSAKAKPKSEGSTSTTGSATIATGAEHFTQGIVPPLPIAIGDSLKMVRTALKTTQEGKPYRSNVTDKDEWELDFPDKGLRIFFDENRKVDTIRFDAPFSGSIFGVRIGDSRASVVKLLGQPLRSWSDDTRVYYENKVSIDYGQSNTVETMFK
jgi:hypothetical protein